MRIEPSGLPTHNPAVNAYITAQWQSSPYAQMTEWMLLYNRQLTQQVRAINEHLRVSGELLDQVIPICSRLESLGLLNQKAQSNNKILFSGTALSDTRAVYQKSIQADFPGHLETDASMHNRERNWWITTTPSGWNTQGVPVGELSEFQRFPKPTDDEITLNDEHSTGLEWPGEILDELTLPFENITELKNFVTTYRDTLTNSLSTLKSTLENVMQSATLSTEIVSSLTQNSYQTLQSIAQATV